ncbi:MAG: sulfatase/phosphatase domain-containing protein, partial [Chitinophagaceae bacterium]
NGPHSEGGNDPEFFNSNGMYRGKKRDLTDGGIHTPFIAVWKGKIKPNTVSNHIAAVWDVFPTFLDAAKINNNYRLDGISFMPTLTNKKTQTQHPFLYWEFHEEGGKQAVRWGKWKGIQLNVSTQNPSAIQLYDITNDPEEKNNLAASNPEIVQQIATFITQSHVSNKDWPLYHQEKQQQKPAN